jgi:O-acetyl-ADP-ribose deacetylase (regulator of RNase III)
MLEYVSGDILQTRCRYIAQGVATGAQEGLGTGLAYKISRTWPTIQKQFKRYTRTHRFDGGDLFVVPPDVDHPGMLYLATQPDMYHASLPFLNRSLKRLAAYCAQQSIEAVALPKIGAGLGKLDWETEVKPLLAQHLTDSKTVFHVYEDFKLEYEAVRS